MTINGAIDGSGAGSLQLTNARLEANGQFDNAPDGSRVPASTGGVDIGSFFVSCLITLPTPQVGFFYPTGITAPLAPGSTQIVLRDFQIIPEPTTLAVLVTLVGTLACGGRRGAEICRRMDEDVQG